MACSHQFTCPLPNGMHARPAGALEEVARRFAADIFLVNERSGQSANAKSVLGIVGLDIRADDPCRLVASGTDDRAAIGSLRAFVTDVLPHCDDALPAVETTPGEARLPPVLREASVVVHEGTAVVPGIGHGRAVSVAGFSVPDSIPLAEVLDVGAEAARLRDALERLTAGYDARLAGRMDGVETAVLLAHRSVARDPEFAEHLERAVRVERRTVAGAIADAETHFVGMLAATGSALLHERALDVRDVCRQLLREAYGDLLPADTVALDTDAVCLAESLTPGQFLALDRRLLRGLVLTHAGTTSHTVILARSFGIPTLVGVAGLDLAAIDGQDVVVDGDLGVLVVAATEGSRRYYDMEHRRLARRRARLDQFGGRPAVTDDGQRIEVAANVASAAGVRDAFAAGADAIGLFRTEMLFLDRTEAPGEEEQFDEYRRALEEADGRPVIVRTLDVGGDKPLPYLRLPREANPFLGSRGVRIYPEFEPLFRTQVRALARASAFGRLRLMAPMVSRVGEAAFLRRVVAEEQARLSADGVAFDAAMEIGAMVEVPSAAFLLGPLSETLDFFSIGTNDLLQYFMAVDRSNNGVADLSSPIDPSFLRLLDQIVRGARERGRWVGLCGEMGGQARYLPLLVGLGLDEVSMAPPDIAAAKAEISALSAARCRDLLAQAMQAATAADVERLLGDPSCRRPRPLSEPALVETGADCRTKAEAIKAGVDLLSAAGRTDAPRAVEEAVWLREASYSTGFGHGFAIPHCKTDAVGANSLAVVKLQSGVEWDALDGKPVDVLILLVVRESEPAAAHMKVLAALARQLMHDEFRDRVRGETDAVALCALLTEHSG